MTLRVAITGISGDVGRGAISGLRRAPADAEPIWLLGLDTRAYPECPPLLDHAVQLPLVQDPAYLHVLGAALRDHAIDVLLSGIDSEAPLLSAGRDSLAAGGTRIVVAPPELVMAADDKLLTARYLTERGIAVPTTCDASSPEDVGFPVIAKPRRGNGSRGIVVLSDLPSLCSFLDTGAGNYCLQQHIDGPEFTVGLLYDRDGVLRDAIAMERTLESGRTVRATVADGPEISRFMQEFGQKVPGRGAVNVQLRWDEHRGPMVFEVNARLSGSTDMRVAVGFNDPLRLAWHFGRGTPIAPARPLKATVYRTANELRVEPC